MTRNLAQPTSDAMTKSNCLLDRCNSTNELPQRTRQSIRSQTKTERSFCGRRQSTTFSPKHSKSGKRRIGFDAFGRRAKSDSLNECSKDWPTHTSIRMSQAKTEPHPCCANRMQLTAVVSPLFSPPSCEAKACQHEFYRADGRSLPIQARQSTISRTTNTT